MQWSKLKQLIENNFAESLSTRISVHSARYGASTMGHAWLTLDGAVIANFCTNAHFNRFKYGDKSKDRGVTGEEHQRYSRQFVEYGEISQDDVYKTFWTYVHDMSFDDSVRSKDPLVQSLVVLDKRLGKRRLITLAGDDLHPLAAKLLEVRKKSEHINPVTKLPKQTLPHSP